MSELGSKCEELAGSDRLADIPDRQFRAMTRHVQRNDFIVYSITSSARASSPGGTVRPSIRAVW